MHLFLTFLFGVGNFAIHAAVRACGHPVLSQLPWKVSYALEFIFLVGALLLVANGHPGWAWVYLLYTALNGLAAWLILSRRI